MAQMKRLMGISEAIARCSEALAELAVTIDEVFSAAYTESETTAAAQPDTPIETKPTITIAQVREVLAAKVCAGYGDAVKALLNKHGVDKLSDVSPADYEELLSEAEALNG